MYHQIVIMVWYRILLLLLLFCCCCCCCRQELLVKDVGMSGLLMLIEVMEGTRMRLLCFLRCCYTTLSTMHTCHTSVVPAAYLYQIRIFFFFFFLRRGRLLFIQTKRTQLINYGIQRNSVCWRMAYNSSKCKTNLPGERTSIRSIAACTSLEIPFICTIIIIGR
jgi:hypothetical protein